MTFAKIGMFTIGGGYAMIPLIEREIVKKRWMSKEDFMEMFALTQSLPGVFYDFPFNEIGRAHV